MSTATGSPSKEKKPGVSSPERPNKGKGKGKNTEPPPDNATEEDEEDDEEDDDEEMGSEDDDEDEEEEEDPEIDPRAIMRRRTRGIKVDYTSKEALAKAGLGKESDEDDEDMKHE